MTKNYIKKSVILQRLPCEFICSIFPGEAPAVPKASDHPKVMETKSLAKKLVRETSTPNLCIQGGKSLKFQRGQHKASGYCSKPEF